MEPINILLSRDELLFVLDELQADFLPGLDPDPMGNLTPEQQTVALTVARRALQARELVRRYSGGELVLHNALLTAVGICAYAHNAVLVYHWPAQAATPVRYFGHIRGDDVVAHSRPEDVLHLFSLLPSRDYLLAQVLAVAEFEDVPAAGVEFSLAGEVFGRARALAEAGETAQAVDLLAQNGVDTAGAEALVKTLTGSPRATILQTIKQPGDGSVQKRDFTLLQNGGPAWLVRQTETDLQVKTTTKAELQTLLAEWVL